MSWTDPILDNTTEIRDEHIEDIRAAIETELTSRGKDLGDVADWLNSQGLRWRFNETVGSTASEDYDSNDMTLTSTSWITGEYGNGVHFNFSGYGTASTAVTDAYDVTFWLKRDGTTTHYKVILAIDDEHCQIMCKDEDRRMYVRWKDGWGVVQNTMLSPGYMPDDTDWHFYHIKLESQSHGFDSNTVYAYVDKTTYLGSSTFYDTEPKNINIYGNYDDTGSPMGGLADIDDLRVFYRHLTSREIDIVEAGGEIGGYPGIGLFPSDDWTDNPVSVSVEIRNKHIYELRACVDYFKFLDNEDFVSWTDPVLRPYTDPSPVEVRHVHITEIRDLLAASVPTTMIAFFDTPSELPSTTDWPLCDGDSGRPNCINVHMRGSNAQGTQTGSDTHTDSAVGNINTTSVGGPAVAQFAVWGTLREVYTSAHYHTVSGHSHGSADHKPRGIRVEARVAGDGFQKAKSLIYFRGSSAPSGWAAYSYTGYYFYGVQNPGGSTGNPTHYHGNAYPSISLGNYVNLKQQTTRTNSMPGHNQHDLIQPRGWKHNCSGSNDPVHVDLMVIQADSKKSQIPSGAVAFFIGNTAPTGWSVCDGTGGTPNYQNAFVKISTSYNDTQTGSNTHTDTSPATDGIEYPNYSAYGNTPFYGTYVLRPQAHNHTLPQHNHGAGHDNVPRYIPLLICIKN